MANGKRASMREGPAGGAVPQDREDAEDEPREPPPSSRAAPPRRAARRERAATPAAPPARERPAAPGARAPPRAARRAPHVPTPAGAPAPRLLLGHPREHDGAPRARAARRADYAARATAQPPRTAGPPAQPVIRVVGVGGAGVNAVNRMVEAEVEGVEFIAVNTDLQSLQQSTADLTLHIGAELTRGLGSGSDPDVGRQAAMEDYDRIKALLKGSDMIFITAGAGGGTGTGAAPIVARIAREVGALTVGDRDQAVRLRGLAPRASRPSDGIERARRRGRHADRRAEQPPAVGARQADRRWSRPSASPTTCCARACRASPTSSRCPGLINLDFADVRTIMSDAGNALLGIGMGVGENRAIEAAEQAVSSPLLETSMEGARSILLSITGGDEPVAVGGQRGRQGRLRGRAPRREHHLRRDGRREARRPGVGDGRRDRLRRRGPAQERQHAQEPARRAAGSARGRAARRRSAAAVSSVDELDVPEFMPRR